jgi:hypothetical protein
MDGGKEESGHREQEEGRAKGGKKGGERKGEGREEDERSTEPLEGKLEPVGAVASRSHRGSAKHNHSSSSRQFIVGGLKVRALY